jgi:hypothetical protein
MTQPPEEPSAKPAAPPAPPQGQPWTRAQQPNAGGHPPAFQPYPPGSYPGSYPPPYAGFPTPAPGSRDGLGTVSLVIGIVALVFSWVPFVGFMLGIIALATAVKARGRVKRGEATNNGVAIASIVLSTVATIIGGAISLVLLVMIWNYTDCIDHARDRYAYSQC